MAVGQPENAERLRREATSNRDPTSNSWADIVANAEAKSPAVPPWVKQTFATTQSNDKSGSHLLPAIAGLLKSVVMVIKTSQETGSFDANGAIKLIEEWETKFLPTVASQDDFPSLSIELETRQRRSKFAPFKNPSSLGSRLNRSDTELSAARDHMPDLTLERNGILLGESCETPIRHQSRTPSEDSLPYESTVDTPSSAPCFNLNIRPLDAGTPLAYKPLQGLGSGHRSSPKRKTSGTDSEEPANKQVVIAAKSTEPGPSIEREISREEVEETPKETLLTIGHGPEGAITMKIPAAHQGPLQARITPKQHLTSRLPSLIKNTNSAASAATKGAKVEITHSEKEIANKSAKQRASRTNRK